MISDWWCGQPHIPIIIIKSPVKNFLWYILVEILQLPHEMSSIKKVFRKYFSKLKGKHRKQTLKVFCQKGVLKYFAKFLKKYLCQSLFFNKVADWKPETLSKKRLQHRCFPVNFVNFSRRLFFRTFTNGRFVSTSAGVSL